MSTTLIEDNVKKMFHGQLAKIESALPAGRLAPQFVHAALGEFRVNPQLYDCTQSSIMDCVFKAATLDLPFGGVLGYAYLVPFQNRKGGRTDCTLIVGYKGLMELCRRSGEILDIRAAHVYEGDEFKMTDGLSRTLHHVATGATEDPAKITHVYVVARLRGMQPNEEPIWDCWTRAKIERHKERFAKGTARADSPWQSSWPEMAAKTVIRAMINRGRLPMSVAVRGAMAAELEAMRRMAAENHVPPAAAAAASASTGEAMAAALSAPPRKIDQEELQAAMDSVEESPTRADVDAIVAAWGGDAEAPMELMEAVRERRDQLAN